LGRKNWCGYQRRHLEMDRIQVKGERMKSEMKQELMLGLIFFTLFINWL